MKNIIISIITMFIFTGSAKSQSNFDVFLGRDSVDPFRKILYKSDKDVTIYIILLLISIYIALMIKKISHDRKELKRPTDGEYIELSNFEDLRVFSEYILVRLSEIKNSVNDFITQYFIWKSSVYVIISLFAPIFGAVMLFEIFNMLDKHLNFSEYFYLNTVIGEVAYGVNLLYSFIAVLGFFISKAYIEKNFYEGYGQQSDEKYLKITLNNLNNLKKQVDSNIMSVIDNIEKEKVLNNDKLKENKDVVSDYINEKEKNKNLMNELKNARSEISEIKEKSFLDFPQADIFSEIIKQAKSENIKDREGARNAVEALLKLFPSIKDEVKALSYISEEAKRVDQIDNIMRLYAEKIKLYKNDESLDEEEKEEMIERMKDMRSSEMNALQKGFEGD